MSKQVKRLYSEFQPNNYRLSLVPDRDKATFSGSVVISGKKTGKPSKRLTFHQKGLKITSAKMIKHDKTGPKELLIDRINNHEKFDEVRLHSTSMVYPGNYEVVLEFTGNITEGMHGIYPCNYKIKNKSKQWIATQFESHHAREAFPCIDEPEAKAVFELSLAVPEKETALSNMPAKKKASKKGFVDFEPTPKMSTYLLAFVIGEMQHKEVVTKDGVKVRVWATETHEAKCLDFGLDVAKRAIEFFNDYYGIPYPLAKSDQVALPDFSSAAMENWGLITYREPFILADPETATQSNRETIAMVVSHELAHQWFGNLVTMKWWDDLWLNESFANVMEYVAVNALFPEWDIWNTFVTQEGLSAFRRDSIAGVQSVRTSVHHPDEISSLFDPSIVYAKGGRLLNMLMNYIGEKDFRAGLKIYFQKHAYGNTTGADLWRALTESSGKDIAGFMDPWLEKSGFPVVTVTQEGSNVNFSQHHFLLDSNKAKRDRTWPIPLLSSNKNIPDLLDKRKLAVNIGKSAFVQINKDAVGHYIVNYETPEHKNKLAELAHSKKLSAPERLMLLSDNSLLARSGILSQKNTLELLKSYTNEDNESVWDIISLVLSDTRRFIDMDLGLEKHIKLFTRTIIEQQYKRLGWRPISNESSKDTKLRALILGSGVYSEHPKITHKAHELFEDFRKDNTSVIPELRGLVIASAIRGKLPKAFDYLLSLEESTSDVSLKPELMGSLCLTDSPKQISMLLERIKDPNKVRAHDVDHWLAYLLRSRHAGKLAWDWMRDNWSWLEKTFGSDKSYDYLPRYAASAFNTRELMEQYKEFFTPLKDQPALARNIEMGIEELENRITWIEKDHKTVSAFFKDYR